MSCQICVEVCPFDAIKMDTAYEYSTSDRFGGLLVHKDQLAKPNSHFNQIHPTEAAGVDVWMAAEKAKAAAKAKADAAKAATTAGPKPTQPAATLAPAPVATA